MMSPAVAARDQAIRSYLDPVSPTFARLWYPKTPDSVNEGTDDLHDDRPAEPSAARPAGSIA